MKINLKEYLVLDGGNLDLAATLEKFEKDVVDFHEFETKATEQIHVEVNALFDAHAGQTLPMPFIASAVLSSLKVTPNQWGAYSEKITEYLHAATEQGILKITKGPKGGVSRALVAPTAE